MRNLRICSLINLLVSPSAALLQRRRSTTHHCSKMKLPSLRIFHSGAVAFIYKPTPFCKIGIACFHPAFSDKFLDPVSHQTSSLGVNKLLSNFNNLVVSST